MAREERSFWVWNGWSREGPIEATGLATGNPVYWWFPEIGEPGWGTSMALGYGAFETRAECLNYHLREAERSLKYARERIDKIRAWMETPSVTDG